MGQVAAEGPPAAHWCGWRHPGGPVGGSSELYGGLATTEPASCWSASRSAHLLRTAPVTRADQGTVAAWSQLSLAMGEALAPVGWDVWGGESHSRAPGLGSGPPCMRHAVPRPVRAGPGPGCGRAPRTRPACLSGVPRPTRRGRVGTRLPGPLRSFRARDQTVRVTLRSRPTSSHSGLPKLKPGSTANPARGAT